jgi:hypothetical protein
VTGPRFQSRRGCLRAVPPPKVRAVMCFTEYSFSCTHTSPTTAPSQSHKKRQHRKGDASEPAEASRSEVSIIGRGSEIRWSYSRQYIILCIQLLVRTYAFRASFAKTTLPPPAPLLRTCPPNNLLIILLAYKPPLYIRSVLVSGSFNLRFMYSRL